MKKITSLLMVLMLMISLVSCGAKEDNKQVTENAIEKQSESVEESNTKVPENLEFKIGGLGPITGGAAVYGTAVKNGIQIAIDEINANGGINGYKVDYRFEDDEHDTEKVISAYNNLKDWGLQILIGTTTSSPCISVAGSTFKDNVFQITPSGSAVDCVANPNVFRVCFSDPNQGVASANYIADNGLANKIGIIYDASDVYSSGIYEKFVETAAEKGLEIVAEESFTSDSKTDFSIQLTSIKNAGADLLFLPFYYSEAALVLNQAKQMGYSPKFFGCDGLDGLLTLDNFNKDMAEGVMLLTPFSADATDELTQNFVNKYKNNYNDIPNQFAADAYDAAYIIKKACEVANLNPNMSNKELCQALSNTLPEISVDGLTGEGMVWDKNGEPNKEPKAVVIENGTYKLMEN